MCTYKYILHWDRRLAYAHTTTPRTRTVRVEVDIDTESRVCKMLSTCKIPQPFTPEPEVAPLSLAPLRSAYPRNQEADGWKDPLWWIRERRSSPGGRWFSPPDTDKTTRPPLIGGPPGPRTRVRSWHNAAQQGLGPRIPAPGTLLSLQASSAASWWGRLPPTLYHFQ